MKYTARFLVAFIFTLALSVGCSASGIVDYRTVTSLTSLTSPSTGTQTNVDDTDTITTILAANTARKGATIVNDSTATLYILCATGTVSATSFTYRLSPGSTLELPILKGGVYTGIIRGIWTADASGTARITEFN